jgi:hypothetical protein
LVLGTAFCSGLRQGHTVGRLKFEESKCALAHHRRCVASGLYPTDRMGRGKGKSQETGERQRDPDASGRTRALTESDLDHDDTEERSGRSNRSSSRVVAFVLEQIATVLGRKWDLSV